MTWISDSRSARSRRSAQPLGTTAIVLALFLGAAVSGCTGDGEGPSASTAQAPPTSTPATTAPVSEPTASRPPAPDPPEPSEEMAGKDELAAIAAAEYFLDALNFGVESGQTTPLAVAVDPSCTSCREIIDALVARSGNGAWQVGGTISYSDATVPSNLETATSIPVQFAVTQSAAKVYDATGNLSGEIPERHGVMRLDLSYANGRWLVAEIAQT